MADVNDLVAFGFGSWSTVNSIPTLGLSIPASAPYTRGFAILLEDGVSFLLLEDGVQGLAQEGGTEPDGVDHYVVPDYRPHYAKLLSRRPYYATEDDRPHYHKQEVY